MTDWRVEHGDCLDLMLGMDADSVDAIVTDPPYGLGFMGKDWDRGVPGEHFWAEALRVAKPGAHLLAFGGTRTFHRLACAIEDAGWEVRDCLSWLYGSGFPKSLDVSKAMDKASGAARERNVQTYKRSTLLGDRPYINDPEYCAQSSEPVTDLAKQWDGWGTALKPAWEPIIMARKPLRGTVAANVTAHGTGALNVDGCRVGAETLAATRLGVSRIGAFEGAAGNVTPERIGRWPANVVLDEEAAAMLDEQSGPVGGYAPIAGNEPSIRAKGEFYGYSRRVAAVHHGRESGASRFFYCAKASRSERESGLHGMDKQSVNPNRKPGSPGSNSPGAEAGATGPRTNHHPTVKPVALMRWLCRLVTPPGGLILDPFSGSGSTGVAAVQEGFRFVGIECEAEYVEIARRRIAHAAAQPSLLTDDAA